MNYLTTVVDVDYNLDTLYLYCCMGIGTLYMNMFGILYVSVFSILYVNMLGILYSGTYYNPLNCRNLHNEDTILCPSVVL